MRLVFASVGMTYILHRPPGVHRGEGVRVRLHSPANERMSSSVWATVVEGGCAGEPPGKAFHGHLQQQWLSLKLRGYGLRMSGGIGEALLSQRSQRPGLRREVLSLRLMARRFGAGARKGRDGSAMLARDA
jgi:hypothetical protein